MLLELLLGAVVGSILSDSSKSSSSSSSSSSTPSLGESSSQKFNNCRSEINDFVRKSLKKLEELTGEDLGSGCVYCLSADHARKIIELEQDYLTIFLGRHSNVVLNAKAGIIKESVVAYV